jgi:hypothetical protein
MIITIKFISESERTHLSYFRKSCTLERWDNTYYTKVQDTYEFIVRIKFSSNGTIGTMECNGLFVEAANNCK